MNASSVFKQFGFTCIITGAMALACAAFSGFTGDLDTARGLFMTALVGLFIGSFLLVLLWHASPRTGAREGLAFVVVFWFVTPLLAAPPFIASGVSHGWIEAVFESVSNLTTTGSSIADSIQPDAIRVWRSGLQFIGGVGGVIMMVVVLAALNLTGPGIHRSHLFTLSRHDLFDRTVEIGAVVSVVYGGAAILGTVAMMFSGELLVDALTRSVAAVTTSSTLAGEGGAYAFTVGSVIAVTLLLFVGATNVANHSDILRQGGWRNYLQDREAIALLTGAGLVGAGMCFLKGAFDIRLIIEALSFMTTSGMNVTGTDGVIVRLPQPMPDVLAFVGGSALSTAGGIKIARVFILMSRAGAEFRRSAFSHSMATLRVQGRVRKDNVVLGVWVYLIAYIGATVLLAIALSAAGVDMTTSFRASVGAISNTGPLVDVAVLDQAPSIPTLLALSLGCILGRIEVLALAPLFTFDFWRR